MVLIWASGNTLSGSGALSRQWLDVASSLTLRYLGWSLRYGLFHLFFAGWLYVTLVALPRMTRLALAPAALCWPNALDVHSSGARPYPRNLTRSLIPALPAAPMAWLAIVGTRTVDGTDCVFIEALNAIARRMPAAMI